jgi:hypothetical protein
MKILFALLAVLPVAALAGPFDGTWKVQPDATQFATKPEVWSINMGVYDCGSCAPKVRIKADGSDQPVSGHPYYDTIAVKVVSDTTVRLTYKKAGKVMFDNTDTVSADHNTLTLKWTDQSGTQAVTGENTFKRGAGVAANGPAGAHAVSGIWQFDAVKSISDAGALVSYLETADGMKMSNPTGQSYEAKFDSKEVPLLGDAGNTTIALKRVGPREIEETDRHDGKVSDVIAIRVSADGRKLIVSDNDTLHDRTDVYVLAKQP